MMVEIPIFSMKSPWHRTRSPSVASRSRLPRANCSMRSFSARSSASIFSWLAFLGPVDLIFMVGYHSLIHGKSMVWYMSENIDLNKFLVGLPWEFVDLYGSMDWFKGHFTGKPHHSMGKSMVSCRFSLKPIQWMVLQWWPYGMVLGGDSFSNW